MVPAQFLSILFGILLGLVAAWRRGTATDMRRAGFSLVHLVLPTFFLAIILLFFGRHYLGLPTGGKQHHRGRVRERVRGGGATSSGTCSCRPSPSTLVLLGEYMLIMRSSVLEVFSRGLHPHRQGQGPVNTFAVIRGHALRNAMLPMVTLIALNLALHRVGRHPGRRRSSRGRAWASSPSKRSPSATTRSCRVPS